MKAFVIVLSLLAAAFDAEAQTSAKAPSFLYACKKPGVPQSAYQVNLVKVESSESLEITILDFVGNTSRTEAVAPVKSNLVGGGIAYQGETLSLHLFTDTAPVQENGLLYIRTSFEVAGEKPVILLCANR